MAKDAFYFLIPLLLLAAIGWWLGLNLLAIICLSAVAFVAFFFRDPERTVPDHADAILSPADGRIVGILPHAGGKLVSIFLSVFDVHVNRAPIAGRIVRQTYRPGSFRLAFDERASAENERVEIVIEGKHCLTFTLIAGLVARRIVLWKRPGDAVDRGDRMALIRFGSRVDIVVPEGCRLNIRQGDRVRAGATILAFWGAG